MRTVWIASILLAVLLLGCVSEQESFEARFVCVRLASDAQLRVPACDSVSDCVESFEKSFGHVNADVFSFDGRNAWNDFENSTAKGWLFFNAAKKNLVSIRTFCAQNRPLEGLAPLVNELKQNLLEGFASIDRANAAAVRWMVSEHSALQDAQVERVREEPIFEGFLELQSDLDAFSLSNVASKEGVAVRLEEVKNRLSRALGQSDLLDSFVSTYSNWDLASPALTSAQEKKDLPVFVPQLLGFAQQTLAQLSWQEKWSATRFFLDRLDVFGLFLAVSDSMGTENSITSDFLRLVRSVSEKKKQTLDGILARDGTVSALFVESGEELERLSRTDELFWKQNPLLADVTDSAGPNRLVVQSFEVTDPTTAYRILSESVRGYQGEYRQLHGEYAQNRLSLGAYVSAQKKWIRELTRLVANARFVHLEVQGAIVAGCKTRISAIEQEVKSSVNPVADATASGIVFYASRFKAESDTMGALQWCSRVLEGFTDWQAQKADGLQTGFLDSTITECEARVTKLAQNTAPSEGWMQELAQIGKTRQSNPLQAYSECETLSDRLVHALYAQPRVTRLVARFENMSKGVRELQLMRSGTLKKSDLDWLEKKILELSPFFGNNPMTILGLEQLSDVEQLVANADDTAGRVFATELAAFLSQHANVVTGNQTVWTTGQTTQDEWTMVLENPFEADWNRLVVVSIDLNAESAAITKSDGVASAYWANRVLTVVLPAIRRGQTRIALQVTGTITIAQSEEVLSATTQRAVIRKKILLQGPTVPAPVRVSMPLDSSGIAWGELSVRTQDQSLLAGMDADSNLVFSLPAGAREAEVLFSVYEPIRLTSRFLEMPQEVRQVLTAKNRTRWIFPKPVVFWPRLAGAIEKPLAWDSSGHGLVVDCAGDACHTTLLGLTSNQTEDVTVIWSVLDATLWAQEQKEALKADLEVLFGQDPKAARLLSELLETDATLKTGREKIAQMIQSVFDLKQDIAIRHVQQSDFDLLEQSALLERARLEKEIRQMQDLNAMLDPQNVWQLLIQADHRFSDAQAKAKTGSLSGAETDLLGGVSLLDTLNQKLSGIVNAQEQSVLKEVAALEEKSSVWGIALDADLRSFAKIDALISKKEFSAALNALQEKKKKLAAFSDSDALLKNRADEIARQVHGIRNGFDAADELIASLRQALPSSDEQALTKMGVVLGYSNRLASDWSDRLKKMGSKSAVKPLDSFETAYGAGDYEKALDAIDQMVLTQTEKDLDALQQEMRSALDSLKSRAESEVGQAEHESAGAPSADLVLARKKLENGEYGKALILVRKNTPSSPATGLAGFAPDWPAVTIPIVLLIVIVAAYRFRQKGKEPAEKPKIKIERVQSTE
ncbi:MAG: hypothetical protein Q7R47_06755 [Candidatus Diapherotrites archaeon]|nr:hypothetical protein [Candidatus Diapherotrites archaeon]